MMFLIMLGLMMLNSDGNDVLGDRSVSKRDQVTYKTTVQLFANRCLGSMGTLSFYGNVDALKSALYFNVEGLHLKDRIDAFLIELREGIDEFRDRKVAEIAEKYAHNRVITINELCTPDRAKLKLKMKHYYYKYLFEYLVSLMAEYEMLMKSKEFVEQGEGES